MIGRGKPGMRKKPAPVEKDEPRQKIKAGIFEDDDGDVDFGNSRTQIKKPQQTGIDFADFANSKPTFAARRNKIAS